MLVVVLIKVAISTKTIRTSMRGREGLGDCPDKVPSRRNNIRTSMRAREGVASRTE